MDNAITLQTIVTIIGFTITILTFITSRRKDVEAEASERTKMYAKIDTTYKQINDILRRIENISGKFDASSVTVSRHDEQLHHIIKILELYEQRLQKLEEKCRNIQDIQKMNE